MQVGHTHESNLMSKYNVVITWKDISVYALDFRRKICKQVVNNVKGFVKPGELTGILGGSGSGKSSLMTALSFRFPKSLTVQGDIRVNGCLVDSSYMRQNSGYMHQEDIFIGTMTVSEHLWFMARMKLSRKIEVNEISARIQSLLMDVGLSSRYDATIGSGDVDKVLSGGEKKRLAFAAELLSDPSILFLDEPTTGQDAYTASILIDQLQTFTNRGRTVLCTIHQPSSSVFSSFQKIILVADGRIAFAGTIHDAVNFFQGYVCPHSYNPADYLVSTLVSSDITENGNQKAAHRICDAFLLSDACKEIDLILRLERLTSDSEKQSWRLIRKRVCKISLSSWNKLIWLVHRGFVQVLRDPSVQFLRIFQKIIIAFVAGLCFLGTVKLDQLGIQAVQGVIFILVSENTFFPMYSTLSLIPEEFPLFFREYKAGMYSVGVYYVSRIISLLPGLIIEPLIFTSIVYWLAGLAKNFKIFGSTVCIIFLTINVSTACGFFFSTAFENVPLAMAYLIPFDYLLMITMGSFIKLSSLPVYIQWVKYISWLLHSTEALSIIHWSNVKNISCNTATEDLPCITEGEEVLQQYDFSKGNFNLDVCLMIIIYIIFHLFGYIFLLKKCEQIKVF